MASHQILVFSGSYPERQPAGDTLSLTGPLDTVTSVITATGALTLAPGGSGGIQADNTRNARGDFAIDLQLSTDANTQVASGSSAMILGGARNTANGTRSMVVGGEDNISTGTASCVLSGDGGVIDVSCAYSVIAGGQSCELLNSDYSFIGCGDTCTINASNSCFIGGGVSNDIASGATSSVIAGGSNNDVTGVASAILGGQTNVIAGTRSAIGAGQGQSCSGDYAGIFTGNGCSITGSGDWSVICGGASNAATNAYAIVGGGRNNTVSGLYSTSIGGRYNVASGVYSTCLGGYDNDAVTGNSVTMGRQAKTFQQGQFAFASAGGFAAAGDCQRMLNTLRRATSNATSRYMYVDGASEQLTVPADTSWTFDLLVNAIELDGSNSAGYSIQGVITRDGTANVAFVGGTPTTTVIAESDSNWDCVVEADTTNQALAIKITGVAATTVRWNCRAEILQTQAS